MIRAMNVLNVTHIDCTVHQIQLCVRAGIESEDYLLKIIEKNKIATHFNHSILAQDKLRKIQTQRLNQSSLAVIQDCPTRWNSTYYMMERLLKIKDSIVSASTSETSHNNEKLLVQATWSFEPDIFTARLSKGIQGARYPTTLTYKRMA
ncbi:PREDICTED: zinc finger BED domain-containing protein 4-like [Trachymyrmex cornetzi]|uniref:zinc finger BED domain-containing protein 4-like n=1 Tax=Trachymyrmex cornetzi TaxID=471704 RepID=UPI00084EEA82|nr:PREDICTED: zinc finger BED domain-containing protein 4-like [Trachymyrmex cornetzi]